MELFDDVRQGLDFVFRYGHVLSGIAWIGLLYYFNFVQVPAFATFEAGPRTESIRKLVPRALWWFRWGAALTLLSGLTILAFQQGPEDKNQLFTMEYFKLAPGVSIATGILLALVMFANVWGVIWPNQKTVIASAEKVAAGGEADPNAAAAGRRALLASRTNTLFSIPMLFFMAATSHFSGRFDTSEGGKRGLWWVVVLVIVLVLELNALGKLGGYDPGPTRKYLDTHRNTIISGFVLATVFYVGFEVCFAA